MCNAKRMKAPANQIAFAFKKAGLRMAWEDTGAIPNTEEKLLTRPTNILPVFRPTDPANPDTLEMAMMRWWLVPFFHKGPDLKSFKAMGTNARADKLKTSGMWKHSYAKRRAVVAADGFIEWTGDATPKARYLIERADGDLLLFPAIWDRWKAPDGGVTESFSIITTAPIPGGEMAAIHNRQPVILELDQVCRWLDLGTDPAEEFEKAGSPNGLLKFTPDGFGTSPTGALQ